ncbi:hypothetical protein HHI36_014285 [Cryptolaemus montrouzieri]|uniref:Trehalase n=1 Tax=Cryptolaemus montrouzieri TaxID=559131 RepID=A0ABD2N281_9CUCU
MMMRFDENTIIQNFKTFMREVNQKPTRNDVRDFVEKNFVLAEELEKWQEKTSPRSPLISKRISQPEYESFVNELMPIWKILTRRIKREVIHKDNITRFSIIPVPNGFVIPGGRFREFYYWDSYWIIVGLLNSGMTTTVKGMLENFLWLIEKFGFIPNGGRIYYLNRSQPPLF